ncbi:MAG: DNRLRE domain-containing protein, partial [Planctomycetota bacterium]
LEYTVDLPAGTYDIDVRYSSGNANPGDLRIKVDGTDVGTISSIQNTGGWNSFEIATLEDVEVTGSGTKVVRLEVINGAYDLDQFRFTPTTSTPTRPIFNEGRTKSQVFNPIDDAYLENGNLFNNTALRIEDSQRDRTSYLKFDVTGLQKQRVTSAKLELVVSTDPGSGRIELASGDSTAWTETNLNPGNAPQPVDLLGTDDGTHNLGKVVEFDLTSAITGNGTVSFVLGLDGGNDVAFGSSESSVPPRLIITSVPQRLNLKPTFGGIDFTPVTQTSTTSLFAETRTASRQVLTADVFADNRDDGLPLA